MVQEKVLNRSCAVGRWRQGIDPRAVMEAASGGTRMRSYMQCCTNMYVRSGLITLDIRKDEEKTVLRLISQLLNRLRGSPFPLPRPLPSNTSLRSISLSLSLPHSIHPLEI